MGQSLRLPHDRIFRCVSPYKIIPIGALGRNDKKFNVSLLFAFILWRSHCKLINGYGKLNQSCIQPGGLTGLLRDLHQNP